MRPLRDGIGYEGAEGDKFSPFHSAAERNEPWVFVTINFASAARIGQRKELPRVVNILPVNRVYR